MAGRLYKPGPRRKPEESMTGNLRAWCKTNLGDTVVYVNPNDDGSPDVVVMNIRQSGARIPFNLTGLTEEELLAYKELMDTAIAWALPIVKERDEAAAHAFAEGDDSHYRSYRRAPQLVFREGPQPSDWQELRERSEGSAPVDVRPVDPNAGLPTQDSGVSERHESGGATEDD